AGSSSIASTLANVRFGFIPSLECEPAGSAIPQVEQLAGRLARIGRAGTPAHTSLAGTLDVTTAFAPTTELAPIEMPGPMKTLAPIQAPSPISTSACTGTPSSTRRSVLDGMVCV